MRGESLNVRYTETPSFSSRFKRGGRMDTISHENKGWTKGGGKGASVKSGMSENDRSTEKKYIRMRGLIDGYLVCPVSKISPHV